jgi:hypothetical protein
VQIVEHDHHKAHQEMPSSAPFQDYLHPIPKGKGTCQLEN